MKSGVLLFVILLFASMAPAQTASDPNEGLRLTREPGVENSLHLSWWGRAGHSYFIQQTSDLVSTPWQYIPVIETGQNAVLGYGFVSSAPRFFARLRIVAQVADDPYAADFDGDGVSNMDELLSLLDPLSSRDVDGDGLPDDWEMFHFGNLVTASGGDSEDHNGDGITDWEAWLLGLNPATPLPDRIAPTWASGSSLTVTDETATGLTLSWPEAEDDRPGAVRYALYRNGQPAGSPSSGKTRQISLNNLSGLQFWHVRPVDAAGNYGEASQTVQRHVGEIVEVGLNVRAKNRGASMSKWGFGPFRTEEDIAPIVRSFATLTVERTVSWETFVDRDSGGLHIYIDVSYSREQTIARTKSPDSPETTVYSGSLDYFHNEPLANEYWDVSGTWQADGTFTGTGTFWEGGPSFQIERGPDYSLWEPLVLDYIQPVTTADTATEQAWECRDDFEDGYESVTGRDTLSDPITDEAHESALLAALPGFETIETWHHTATAYRDWSADRLSLTLGEARYKVRVSDTQEGKRYRVRWLEVFYPETPPEGPTPEPQALAFREVILDGTGEDVESEEFQLLPPTAEGSIGLVQVSIGLSVPSVLRVNDNFDERLRGGDDVEPESWVMDKDTLSPLRSDGTLALADFGYISASGNLHNQNWSTRFGPETSSVKLALAEGASKARMIAVAPTGSGEDGAYTDSDWAVVSNNEELWEKYYGRTDENENSLPDWNIYLEGLEPGKVKIALTVENYGEALSAEEVAYVTKAEFIGRDSENGDVYPMGGLAEGSRPQPEVVIHELDASVNESEGTLTINLAGEVLDVLSEVMDEASSRVGFVTFQINGRAIDGIAPLSVAGGGPVRPWQSNAFSAPFERTITLPIQGPKGIVLRALSGPNSIGERGWDEVWIQVGRSHAPAPASPVTLQWLSAPSSAQADQIRLALGTGVPDSSDPVLVEDGANSGRFIGSLLVGGVQRAAILELAPISVANGAPSSFIATLTYQMGAGNEVVAAFWDQSDGLIYRTGVELPYAGLINPLGVESVIHGEGSGGVAMESIVARVDGLQEAEDSVPVWPVIDSGPEVGESLTFSPEYFYPVLPSRPGQPLRFVVGIDDNRRFPANEAVSAVRAGGNNFLLRAGNQLIDGAILYGVETAAPQVFPAVPRDLETIEQVRALYALLYCQPAPNTGGVNLGKKMLDYYDSFNWGFEIDDGDDEVDLKKNGDGSYTMLIGSELDPITAAQGMFEALVKLAVHPRMQNEVLLDGYGPEFFSSARLSAVRTQGHQVGGVALEIYKTLISITNEGADWAVAIDEVSNGNYAAAIGFLPFIPAVAKYIVKHRATGQILMQIEGSAAARLTKALSDFKVDVNKVYSRKETIHVLKELRDAGAIQQNLIDVLVDSNHLRIKKGTSRKNLKAILGDPPGNPANYRAHHWLPLEHEDEFLRQCLDPNDAPHGQWLTKQVHSDLHNKAAPDFTYKGAQFSPARYNEIWEQYFEHFPNADDVDIKLFLLHLKKDIYNLL